MARKIGVDIGGSWLRVGLFEPDAQGGSLRTVDRHPSPDNWAAFTAILAKYDAADVEGFGIAIAGPIKDHATVVKGPNLAWLDGRPVRKDLEAALGKKVVVSNDMESATEGQT